MLKTYRIIPVVFILFFFGFTLFTVSPVIASTIDQLIERIEKLEAAVFPEGQTVPPVVEQPTLPPVVEQPTLTPVPSKIDGPWDKSMGMRHPARPCMLVNSCGPDRRTRAQIASDPYDTNNPATQAARPSTFGRGQSCDVPGCVNNSISNEETRRDAMRMLKHKGLR